MGPGQDPRYTSAVKRREGVGLAQATHKAAKHHQNVVDTNTFSTKPQPKGRTTKGGPPEERGGQGAKHLHRGGGAANHNRSLSSSRVTVVRPSPPSSSLGGGCPPLPPSVVVHLHLLPSVVVCPHSLWRLFTLHLLRLRVRPPSSPSGRGRGREGSSPPPSPLRWWFVPLPSSCRPAPPLAATHSPSDSLLAVQTTKNFKQKKSKKRDKALQKIKNFEQVKVKFSNFGPSFCVFLVSGSAQNGKTKNEKRENPKRKNKKLNTRHLNT